MSDTTAQTIALPTLATPSVAQGGIHILVASGPLQGQEFTFTKAKITIGSGIVNDLSIADSTISRTHCEIRCKDGEVYIKDLKSTNGISIEGIKISEARLSPNTEVQLGRTRLIVPLKQSKHSLELSPRECFGCLVGRSSLMRHLFFLAEQASQSTASVLLIGEAGTGKESLARAIHDESDRAKKPFIVIDCAVDPQQVEIDLFGNDEGKTSALTLAAGGTLFLSEINRLPKHLQALFLRTINQNLFTGRLIASMPQPPAELTPAQMMQEDLYYRLAVLLIDVPALRRRKEDIPLLAKTLCSRLKLKPFIKEWLEHDGTISSIKRYDWPGNAMELRNLLERANATETIPDNWQNLSKQADGLDLQDSPMGAISSDRPFKDVKNELIEAFERQYLSDLLARNAQNISKSARSAGIERAYLQRLIRKYGMRDES